MKNNDIHCFVCDSRSPQIDKRLIDVYKCEKCGHIYINYQGDGLKYHQNEYRKNGHGTKFDTSKSSKEIDEYGIFTENFHKKREIIMNKRCDVLNFYHHGCESILDVGAGGGSFLKKVEKNYNFKEIECQEISEVCIKNLELYGFKTHRGNFNEITFEKTYDIVTAWHVLEHVKDIQLFAKQISKLVNKYLIIEIPIGRKLHSPNRYNKSSWDGHYHYFTEDSLKLLFGVYFTDFRFLEAIQKPSLQVIFKK